jgi:hypothetical protein
VLASGLVRTKLADYLAAAHLSHRAFAQKAGIPHLHPMVCLWARGKARPGLVPALAIEEATKGEIPASYWPGVPVEGRSKRVVGGKRRRSRKHSSHSK